MTLTATSAPRTPVRRLTAALYCYAFLDDLVLLYPVYALLFSDTGLSVWQISSLFALWSLSGVLFELPSGAWADAFSRRTLLWAGPLLTAAGFGLWVLVPSYGSFAVGFVLWGAKGALGSGALEALVYDELDRLGAADRYARTMGRTRAAGLLAVMAANGLAGPVLGAGGYPAVGAASIAACLLAAAAAACLPEHRARGSAGPPDGADRLRVGSVGPPDGADGLPGGSVGPPVAAVGLPVGTVVGPPVGADGAPDGARGPAGGWVAALRAGLAEARTNRRVRSALLLVPAVTAVWGALDEYTPLLVRDTGTATADVPWLLLVVWAAATAGGLLAGPGERLGRRGLAALLACAGVALGVGALLRHPAGVVLVALAFCGFQLASVLADARLQAGIQGPARATLTSLAGTGTDLGTVAVYGAYAAAASTLPHAEVFALFATAYLLTALFLARPAGPEPRPASG
ncbi:MFS transporter [Streptomyces antimicrobicus]|uniref:MFS transporter n=1 Tax=Streptomyces antimicrobicus TaxID=2883108 RepID=A0ABS8BBI3_9ACTN|nr:MFS transporter [Streptomyces antimicrobicus]MCB5181979.1 MFS transporter [Streptomyces antimicrobicus]